MNILFIIFQNQFLNIDLGRFRFTYKENAAGKNIIS